MALVQVLLAGFDQELRRAAHQLLYECIPPAIRLLYQEGRRLTGQLQTADCAIGSVCGGPRRRVGGIQSLDQSGVQYAPEWLNVNFRE